MDTCRKVGTVQWFNENKGFGFICVPGEESDIFVHYTQIDMEDRYKTLTADQLVEFTQVLTTKGLQALDVVPVISNQAVIEENDNGRGSG